MTTVSLRRHPAHSRKTLLSGLVAGLAGGITEVAWIAAYEHATGGGAAAMARAVTETVFPTLTTDIAVPLGITIHMGLAIVLGLAIAVLVRSLLPRQAGTIFEPAVVVGLLVVVWIANFFVILPIINPSFVSLVPLGASLTSKILFGCAAAIVLQFLHDDSAAIERA